MKNIISCCKKYHQYNKNDPCSYKIKLKFNGIKLKINQINFELIFLNGLKCKMKDI